MESVPKEVELPDLPGLAGPAGVRARRAQGEGPPARSPSAYDAQGFSAPLAGSQLTGRQKLWKLFEEPTSSHLALAVAGVMILTIVISVGAFILSTLPKYMVRQQAGGQDNVWPTIETVCVTIFTLEFVLRLGTCPSIGKFVRNPMNMVDFLAILPYYAELAMKSPGSASSSSLSSGAVRAIRLVRIFRIFKIARYLPWVRVFVNALLLSVQPLLMLFFIIMIACVIFSSAIFYAERGEWSAAAAAYLRPDGSVSFYQSIPDSMWWCIVTMTTVGYGDMYPVTFWGRMIASIAALSGVLVIAIPITIISTNFNAEYQKLQREREQLRARMLLLKGHLKANKAGLDAILSEIDDMVKRNMQEFMDEMEGLFEQSRKDLTEEIGEVVKMAFDRRRQLHLQAVEAKHGSAAPTASAGGLDR